MGGGPADEQGSLFELPPAGHGVPPLLAAVLADVDPGSAVIPERLRLRRRAAWASDGQLLHGTVQSLGKPAPVYYLHADADGVVKTVIATWEIGVSLEGPPGNCHGGCIASFLDDVSAALTYAHLQSKGFAKSAFVAVEQLHVTYKAKTPLPGAIACVATLGEVLEDCKVTSSCRLLSQKADASFDLACLGEVRCRMEESCCTAQSARPSVLPCCASLVLEGLRRLFRSRRPLEEEIPEIYRARYEPLPPYMELPLQLTSALRELHGTQALRKRAFRRQLQKFPHHFLHATLRGRGLGEAFYYFDTDKEDVVQTVLTAWDVGPGFGGLPGCCHGGGVAALLDDAFGALTNTHLRSLGRSGEAVTAYLRINRMEEARLPCSLICMVSLQQQEGRKVFNIGRVFRRNLDNSFTQVCEGEALFVELVHGYAGKK